MRAEALTRELDFVFRAVARDPANESAWAYLRGLYDLDGSQPLGRDAAVLRRCSAVLAEFSGCPPALGFSLDCLEAILADLQASGSDPITRSSVLEKARSVCQALMVADPIRYQYWGVRERELVSRFS